MPAAPTAASRLNPFHRANRLTVVIDVANFLVQHHAAVGTFTDTVEAALAFACGLNADQWAALGVLTGHYAHGTTPADDTIADVLRHLESMLPVTTTAPGRPDGSARLNATIDAADQAVELLTAVEADPFEGWESWT